QFRFARLGRKFVPWADRQAIVAAKDAVSHKRPEFARDRALVFDRKVRNAATRIEDIGARKGFCWADVEAGTAASAMVFSRPVGQKPQIGEDRTQKEPGAKLAGDEIAVLALPAKARRLRQRLFHDGRGVDEDLEVRAPGLCREPLPKLLEPALDE